MHEARHAPCHDICLRLQSLLQRQHDALVRNEPAEAEQIAGEVTSLLEHLTCEEKRRLAADIESIRLMHERMFLVLAAQKKSIAAELAAVRQKRSLNRKYGGSHE